MLYTSLLLIASFTNLLVSAAAFSHSELNGEEHNSGHHVSRALYAQQSAKGKNQAIKFVKNIPPEKLVGLGPNAHKVATWDENEMEHTPQNSGFRLDNQGGMSGGRINLQVQKNGKFSAKEKTTVGGVITDGTLSGKKLRKELVHSVMHPAKDSNGNDVMRFVGKKTEPAKSGKKINNPKAKPRAPKPRNLNSKAERKKEAKTLGYRPPASAEAQAKAAARIQRKTKH
ncbi:hypothetical protein H0H87_008693 [Tephrocybe sp. NHM501043]|nr:hypothetical protein H0H87_008693 [Tephrocybe sp. NHM501043]